MPVLANRYEYDVFFSYAWASKTGDPYLKEWTRAVATKTAGLLRIRYNSSGSFDPYLDRDENQTAYDLDHTLKSAAERSGVFVAFVSPYYNSDYCLKELDWFFDSHGLDENSIPDRVCIVRIQHRPDSVWPKRLAGSSGQPLLYKDFCDDHGQPRSIAQFVLDSSLPGLGDLINDLALEIADKIESIRSTLKAQEDYINSQYPPDRPLFFFEAEPGDQPRWVECGRHLKNVPSIVLPPGSPRPATEISPEDDLQGCYGMVMLRSRAEDDIGRRIKSAYLHRQKLYRERKEEVRWCLLDDLEEGPPEEDVYEIPRVRLQGDWLKALQMAMRC